MNGVSVQTRRKKARVKPPTLRYATAFTASSAAKRLCAFRMEREMTLRAVYELPAVTAARLADLNAKSVRQQSK